LLAARPEWSVASVARCDRREHLDANGEPATREHASGDRGERGEPYYSIPINRRGRD